MKTKVISILAATILSFSALAADQPPASYRPNEREPAYVAQDKEQTTQTRVAALESLRAAPSQNALIAIARALKEEDPQIQHAAIIGSRGLAMDYRWELVSPFLHDNNASLREAATYTLAKGYPQLSPSHKAILDDSIPELERVYQAKQDSFSRFKLAEVYRITGEAEKAISEYLHLIDITPNNQAVWVGLSEAYRTIGQEDKSIQTLAKAIRANPNASQLYYAKSLAEVRQGNKEDAVKDIRSASILAETNSYYWSLYAMMQKEQDIEASVPLFEHAYQLSGAPEQLFALCDVYIETNNQASNSCVERIKPLAPKSVYASLQSKLEKASKQ